jgi:hypothetical protein
MADVPKIEKDNLPRVPSLAGCWLRILRAHQYIEEAESLIASFASECEERIFNSYNIETKSYGAFHIPDVPFELPLAIAG